MGAEKKSPAVSDIPAAFDGLPLTQIGTNAFYACVGLTSVIVPSSVTNIGMFAFANCDNLAGICFKGNAPRLGVCVFNGNSESTVYHLPVATGWDTTFGRRPAALWEWKGDDKTKLEESRRHVCVRNLIRIDHAKQQLATASAVMLDNYTPTMSELTPYMKGTTPACPDGGTYTINSIVDAPSCSKGPTLGHVYQW